MAAVESAKVPSLAERYALPKDDKPVEAPKIESPVNPAPEESVKEADVLPTVADENSVVNPPPAEESVETPAVVEEVTEKVEEVTEKVAEVVSPDAPEATEEPTETTEEENSVAEEVTEEATEEVVEEIPEIKLETAPADFRFPTTNQTRHCFTRYIEYHRCIAAKGEDAPECDRFAKYYRSLCPGEWVERWNEQRENGTFPGPL